MTKDPIYYTNRLDRYLRRTNFWMCMGILGASFYQDRNILSITGDGFIQIDFEVSGQELKLVDIPHTAILPTQLMLTLGERLSFANLIDRFKILNKMNRLATTRWRV